MQRILFLFLCFSASLFASTIERGLLKEYPFKSAILRNQRSVWIYTPPHYPKDKNTPYNLLIVFDGEAYTQIIPTPEILDNMIAAEQIEPLVAVFVGSISNEIRERELPCNPFFIRFISYELLPWLQKRYFVTRLPSKTIVAGSSYGGLAACFAGLEHPELFGNVLSQSGAFWWKPESDRANTQEGWLIRQFASKPKLPLRFYFNVGKLENYPEQNMVLLHQRLLEIMRSKGYEFFYEEFNGGHEYSFWHQTFSQGITALIGKP